MAVEEQWWRNKNRKQKQWWHVSCNPRIQLPAYHIANKMAEESNKILLIWHKTYLGKMLQNKNTCFFICKKPSCKVSSCLMRRCFWCWCWERKAGEWLLFQKHQGHPGFMAKQHSDKFSKSGKALAAINSAMWALWPGNGPCNGARWPSQRPIARHTVLLGYCDESGRRCTAYLITLWHCKGCWHRVGILLILPAHRTRANIRALGCFFVFLNRDYVYQDFFYCILHVMSSVVEHDYNDDGVRK